MRKCITIILIAISSTLYSQAHYIDPVKLTWQDFRGIVKYDSGFMAFTVAKVSMAPVKKNGNKTIYKLGIDFFPDSSWVDWQGMSKIPKAYQDSLFRHEMLHYYIAIITYKKARLTFPKDKYLTLQEAANFLSPFADWQVGTNTNYDRETNHGGNSMKQKEWDIYITKIYESLKNVSVEPPIIDYSDKSFDKLTTTG
jgi:hypothetical protein